MTEVYITSAVRTPVGRFLGSLSTFTAPQLGSIAIKEAVKRAKIDPNQIDEVIMGCVLQAGVGQAPARQALIYAGLSHKIAALTINKVCGSGLKAVTLAVQAIKAGDADIIVAGGMESMSNSPYLLPQARLGSRMGDAKLVDSLVADGLWDVYNNFHMGMTSELVAEKYNISRREMDEYAFNSHKKALAAIKNGSFKAEIVPVEVKAGKGETKLVEIDEGPREDSTFEKLSTLKPAFKKDGVVTPGNASQISDGASALVVMSEKKVKSLGIKPLARITGYATGWLEPQWVMMTPIEAVKNLEAKYGFNRNKFDLIEINEAFAAQVCAVIKELELDPAKVNINGGGVALGHPIGASGARILTTLLYALKDKNLKTGLATLCLGGGGAVALSVEIVE